MREEGIRANFLGLSEAVWNAEEGLVDAMLSDGQIDEQSVDFLLVRLWRRHQTTWGKFARLP